MNLRIAARVVSCIAALLFASCCFPLQASAREGFFRPPDVHTPYDQSKVLASLVRITENVYWDTIVLQNEHDVKSLAAGFTLYPPTGRKTYLPQGAILWHIVITKAQLLQLMEDPNSAFEEGISDIVRSFRGVQSFPAERITPITGWANATFVSADGLLLTNYHVAREQVEALHREAGCAGEVPARYLRAQAARVRGGRIVGWTPIEHLDLVANVSSADWHAGLDGALLRMRDGIPHGYLPIRSMPAIAKEPVWLYGFPFSSRRPAASLARFAYENADTTLRVSLGEVTKRKGVDFISDVDGINGDSGGAFVDRAGELLGYDWDVYGQSQAARVTSFSGGDIAVSAYAAYQRLLHEPPCPRDP